MKFTLPVILVVATAALMVLALFGAGQGRSTVGIAAGFAVYTPKADTPEQALKIFWSTYSGATGIGHWPPSLRPVPLISNPSFRTGPVPTEACARFQVWKALIHGRCISQLTRLRCA